MASMTGVTQARAGTLAPLEAASNLIARCPNADRIAVAYSGGGDSTGLLVALHQVARAQAIELVAVTVDHGLRAESAAEAKAAGALCRQLDIEHRVQSWKGEKPTAGLMAAARDARHALLRDCAKQLGADFVVTGHTLDDQLETVAMRQMRASDSARGLAGIAEATLVGGDTWFVRPFLQTRRADIREFLQNECVQWIDDPSNENRAFERIRVRNDDRERVPVAMVRKAAENRCALSVNAAQCIAHHATSPLPGYFVLPVMPIDDGAFRHALSTLIALAGGQAFLPGRGSLQRLHDLLSDGRDFVFALSRAVVERRRDLLHVTREARHLPTEDHVLTRSFIWDDRFCLTVRNGATATIGGQGILPSFFEDATENIPRRVRQRIAATMPRIKIGDWQDVTLRPHLPIFDRYLPNFDFELANAAAHLVGRAAYAHHPLNLNPRK